MRISDWSSDVCSSDLYAVQDALQEISAGGAPAAASYAVSGEPVAPMSLRCSRRSSASTSSRRVTSAAPMRSHAMWPACTARRASERSDARSEEHTSELQSLMRISYAVFCLKKTNKSKKQNE